jgi:copper(I)-binding protein
MGAYFYAGSLFVSFLLARCKIMRARAVTIAAFMVIRGNCAAAHEFTSNGVTVAHPWARATPGGVKVGGAYFEMKAAAGKGDRLIAASSPVAGSVEIHNHIMEGGVPACAASRIAIADGKSAVLGPSGYHVMLMDLKQPLRRAIC